jgi:hypothetical protein
MLATENTKSIAFKRKAGYLSYYHRKKKLKGGKNKKLFYSL